MRYILDNNGYLQEVSFGADIECNGKICTEYTGGVPSGYSSLADWFTKECDKLYRWKIVGSQLTLDSSVPVLSTPGAIFAPSNYGLGENNGRWVTDIDSAIAPGFYAMGGDSVAAKLPAGYTMLGYGSLLVERRNENVYQTFRRDGAVAHRYSKDNGATWSPFFRQGMGIEQLWSNASPASSFSAQTISVDWSKYDRIGVQFSEGYTEMLATSGSVCQFVSAFPAADANNNVMVHYRWASLVSGGVKFETGYYLTVNGQFQNNDHGIPLKIYGFTGVRLT